MDEVIDSLKKAVKKRVATPRVKKEKEEEVSDVPQPREKTMTHEGGTINNHYLIT